MVLVDSLNKNAKIRIVVFVIFVVIFAIYNSLTYRSQSYTASVELSEKAVVGQNLWQQNKCWSCHQLYGLGGYLGPDLTNIYSQPSKGSGYISAFLNSGVKSMPKFNFSESEKEAIIEFLKVVDQSGYYPNFDAEIDVTGWVKLKYKNE